VPYANTWTVPGIALNKALQLTGFAQMMPDDRPLYTPRIWAEDFSTGGFSDGCETGYLIPEAISMGRVQGKEA
jgi:hypothetical protein